MAPPSWKSQLALQNLREVAAMNGRKEEGEKLTKEVVSSYIQSEFTAVRPSDSVLDLFPTLAIRKVTCCLMVVWFSNSLAYYGLAMGLQKLGFSIYLVQVLFGVIDILAVLVATTTVTYGGRRATVASFLILARPRVIANSFVPEAGVAPKSRGRVIISLTMALTLGLCIAVLLFITNHIMSRYVQLALHMASSFIYVYLSTGERHPTEIRQMGMGLASVNSLLGGLAAPLVTTLGEFSAALPPVGFGATTILAGLAVCFLAETRDVPLVETIEAMERSCGQHVVAVGDSRAGESSVLPASIYEA